MPQRKNQTRGASPASHWGIAYVLFVLLAGTNVPTPLYRGYEHAFGHSPFVTTLIFASYVAALIPALLIAGPMSDAYGRHAVLVPGIFVAIAASMVLALATSTAWLFSARLLQGLAVGASSGPLTALLSEADPSAQGGRGALIASVVSLGGLGIGPLAGGALAEYGPAPFVTPYLIETLLLAIALAVLVKIPDASERRPWRIRRPSIPSEMTRVFLACGTANFAAFSVIGLFLSLMPAFARELSGWHNLAMAGASATLLLAASVVTQMLVYKRDAHELQSPGLLLLFLGLTTLFLAGTQSRLGLLILAAIIAGAGHGMIFLAGIREIVRLAPAGRQAESISAFYVIVYLGVGLPVIAAGLVATHIGVTSSIRYFASSLALLVLLVFLFLQIERSREVGKCRQ
jgi:predicted MFS family arabinose efflux permease